MDIIYGLIGLIFLAAFLGGAWYWQLKTNFYWKWIGKSKWQDLQPHLKNIRDIHDRTIGVGKKISWIEKNITKSVKKDFVESKKAFDEYIGFCKEKHLDMPSNYVELEELIETTEVALLNPNEALDRELEQVGNRYDEEYKLVDEAGVGLLERRQNAIKVIEEVEELVNSIASHPKSFEMDIQEINVAKDKFKSVLEFGVEQRKALEVSAKSAGAGVAAGAAVASMAPTAAMWVATTFGTASTGTAISALSGAAATNAALAWLGGGALAVGGGGMAAGHALLALAGPIGWGIAGASVAASFWFGWRKKQKIQENKRDEIERLLNCTEALKEIKKRIDMITTETIALTEKLGESLTRCNQLMGHDYTLLSDDQKKELGAIVNNTKALSALLNETVNKE